MKNQISNAVGFAEVFVHRSEMADMTYVGYLGVEIYGDLPLDVDLLSFLVSENIVPLEFNGTGYDENETFSTRVTEMGTFDEMLYYGSGSSMKEILQVTYDKNENKFTVGDKIEENGYYRYNDEVERRHKAKEEEKQKRKERAKFNKIKKEIEELSEDERAQLKEIVIDLM